MSDPIGGFVCEHGRVRRKCEVCELVDAERENARLRALLADVRDYVAFAAEEYGGTSAGPDAAAALARIDAALRGEEKP